MSLARGVGVVCCIVYNQMDDIDIDMYIYIHTIITQSIYYPSLILSIHQSIQKIEIEIPSTKLKSNIDNRSNLWYN